MYELSGRKSGYLTVLQRCEGGWLCKCICGTEKVIKTTYLTGSHRYQKSCGCMRYKVRNKLNNQIIVDAEHTGGKRGVLNG